MGLEDEKNKEEKGVKKKGEERKERATKGKKWMAYGPLRGGE